MGDKDSRDGLWLQVFGRLEVYRDSQMLPLTSPMARTLLAALLVRANQLVPVDQLLSQLWGDELPGVPRAALQVHVSRLRALLGDYGNRIRTHELGYSIELASDELDLLKVQRLMDSRDPAHRLPTLEAAARLCRDHPLTNVRSELIHTFDVPPLLELRRQVEEARIDAMLAAGRHDEVMADLRTLTSEYPLNEPLWGQFILALYRCGRQAEALDTYRTVAANLDESLGIGPSSQLRALHTSVLRQDEDLRVAAQPEPAATEWLTSCQLPMALPDFVGREALTAEIAAILTDSTRGVPLVVLSGEPGIGKSALAIRLGHQLRSSFPDGQWFVSLDGSQEQPRQPVDALGELLTASGVPYKEIPCDLRARAALFRGRTADRKVLLVLDDAHDENQVRDLLPGTPGNAVLLTSRADLSGLAVHHAATCRRLGVLTSAESARLIEQVSGRRADPAAADELSTLCGHLPLTVRTAAANLAAATDHNVDSPMAKTLDAEALEWLGTYIWLRREWEHQIEAGLRWFCGVGERRE